MNHRSSSQESYELAPPAASTLVESLRGFGYSTSTAIADIVDNSIAARAKNVWLDFHFDGPRSRVSILDDGVGMSDSELRAAMVLGSTTPLSRRSKTDLGRFGLGLKTASFSQCRCLTVASLKGGERSVRRWDLDYLASESVAEWRLLTRERPSASSIIDRLDRLSSGTLVIWEGLDRVVRNFRDEKRAHDSFLEVADGVDAHLAMVFQRFIEGPSPRLSLHLNGRRIEAWDPFMTVHTATAPTPREIIRSGQESAELQGFVLPHKDQLDQRSIQLGGGEAGWAAHQGFYVYRSDRLLVAGGWLGLGRPRAWTLEEPFRLARLSVSFENDADSAWQIDVKKSTARPPVGMRDRMTELAAKVRADAREVFVHRGGGGRRPQATPLTTAWEPRSGESAPRYRINRRHPVLSKALDRGGESALAFEEALKVIELTVPVERIWLDTAERGEVGEAKDEGEPPPDMLEIAAAMVEHWRSRVGMSLEDALEALKATEPFQRFPRLVTEIESRLGGEGDG